MRAARTRTGRPIGSDASTGWTVCVFLVRLAKWGKDGIGRLVLQGRGGQGQNLGKLEDEDASWRCAVSRYVPVGPAQYRAVQNPVINWIPAHGRWAFLC